MEYFPKIDNTESTEVSVNIRTLLNWFLISDTSILNHGETKSLKAILSDYDTVTDNIGTIVDKIQRELDTLYGKYYIDRTIEIDYNTYSDSIYQLTISISVVTDKIYELTEVYDLDSGAFNNVPIMVELYKGLKW